MKIFVKPAEGLRVLAPDGAVVPAEGLEVDSSSFWLRRLRDGDVVSVSNAPDKKAR